MPVPMFHLSTRLGLHTSSQWQKKREVERSVLITSTQRHWQEIKKTPKPALFLGFAGAVPFVAVPLTMCLMNLYHPTLASVQVLYGACILSFLGGVRWGYTLPDNSPARPSWVQLLTSTFFPYMAFISLLLMGDINAAMLGLGGGFAMCLAVDVLGIKELEMTALGPLWYKWLRVLLTVIVLSSLIATIGCANRYPEAPTDNQFIMFREPKTRQ